MKKILPELVRDAGYETLFHLGGFLALSVHPTQRNLEKIFAWIDESHARRQHLKRLEERGLVESSLRKGQWLPRLTELGRAAFAGGRHPEEAWNRAWDGQWRLLTFDLPRAQNPERMKLRRWLRGQHFGRLQGSVWISPNPVPSIEEMIIDLQVDPTKLMVFEGTPAGGNEPGTVAAMAWDFTAINNAYRGYNKLTEGLIRSLRGPTPSPTRLQRILRDDRKRWWNTVRHDPLLPKEVHPTGYLGPKAWKIRSRLLKTLGKDLTPTSSP